MNTPDTPLLTTISVTPVRDPNLAEQSFLTFCVQTGAWDLVALDFGEELDLEGFRIGVTHWVDLAELQPNDAMASKAMRQAQWNEEAEATFHEAGLIRAAVQTT